jgi:Family of unknown function (DUF6325)
MSDQSTEAMTGAVEIAVIEFPGSRFTGEIAPALAELVNDGIVTILDLVFITKGEDGTVAGVELADLDEEVSASFDNVDGEVSGLLSDEDLQTAGEALGPGSSAALIVWENTWARRLVGAVRDAGGRLVAHDRLDAETVAAALAASDER